LTLPVLSVVGYLASMEILGRQAYAFVQAEVRESSRKGDFERARSVLEKVAGKYPFSSLHSRVSKQLAELAIEERNRGAQLQKDEEKENLRFGSFLAQIESLTSGKRYLEAKAKVQEIDRRALGASNRRKLAQIEGEIEKNFAAAEEMLLRARELLKQRKYEESHGLFLKLMVNYPSTPASRGLKLPLVLRSTPPGANAVLNGEPAGKTPFTLFYDPFGKFSLSIQKEGFRSVSVGEDSPNRLTIDFAKDWSLTVRLDRIPA